MFLQKRRENKKSIENIKTVTGIRKRKTRFYIVKHVFTSVILASPHQGDLYFKRLIMLR